MNSASKDRLTETSERQLKQYGLSRYVSKPTPQRTKQATTVIQHISDNEMIESARNFLPDEKEERLLSEMEQMRKKALEKYADSTLNKVAKHLAKVDESNTEISPELDSLHEYCDPKEKRKRANCELKNEHLNQIKNILHNIRIKEQNNLISPRESAKLQEDVRKKIQKSTADIERETGRRFTPDFEVTQTWSLVGVVSILAIIIALIGLVVSSPEVFQPSPIVADLPSAEFMIHGNHLVIEVVISSSVTDLEIVIVGLRNNPMISVNLTLRYG